MTDKIDWSIFDRVYPMEDGIVNALPEELQNRVAPASDARHFFDVHPEVMRGRQDADFLRDKQAMASMQMEFYDRMALGFQAMDDNDEAVGGVFNWRVRRCAVYDAKHFKGRTVLFVGAGNCRVARIFARLGYRVVATDISRNMLAVGKERNDRLGIGMTYVAHNAEVAFPFKSDVFDNVYSLCVMNHITDWKNYIGEKLRCLKRYGVFLERLPNALLWNFWKDMGMLYEGIEIKAQYCFPVMVRDYLEKVFHARGDGAQIWTHDHQPFIVLPLLQHLYGYPNKFPLLRYLNYYLHTAFPIPWLYVRTARLLYILRIALEDRLGRGRHDNRGIYTMVKMVK